MASHLRYERPPLREMTCEFRFAGPGWDAAIPGLLFVALQDQFPKRQTVHHIGLPAESQNQPNIAVQVTQATRFQQEDGLAFVQVAPHVVSIHRVAPYPGWLVMKPLISRVLSAYLDQAKPETLTRIGLRYLNDFHFQAENIDPENYFNFHPTIAPPLPQKYAELQTSVVLLLESRRQLRLKIHGVPTEATQTTVRLDLDIFPAPDQIPLLVDAMKWVEAAHSDVRDVFEACLRPSARELLGSVEAVT